MGHVTLDSREPWEAEGSEGPMQGIWMSLARKIPDIPPRGNSWVVHLISPCLALFTCKSGQAGTAA